MKRRDFMISTAALAGGTVLLPRLAFAEAGRIDWYTSSDQNILDFWTNVVKPKFEAANPGITLNLVDGGGATELQALADRTFAALGTDKDPQTDFFEGYDTRVPVGALEKGLWVDFAKETLSNYSKINPLAFEIDPLTSNLPYRGSQVLLAYDTTKLPAADVPKTWADLVTWIKANPGQFIYNRPNKGGSGGNFVRRAIYAVNGDDPSKFTIDGYTEAQADEMLAPAWDVLNDLAPSMFDKGAYTSGNTQSIQMLAQSAVTMVPAWSDQAIQAISQGVLPETTGLVQLSDLGFPGNFTRVAVPTNAANKDASIKLADFILSEEVQSAVLTELGGFPGVSWDNLPAELHEKYKDVIPASIPVFPAGPWDKKINDAWYRNVAPNTDPNA
ncbi:MAG TPA: extracellular solute-binding protein [Devosia sp.]|nr:extracellular solute-binding protein [Devosia sp.]